MLLLLLHVFILEGCQFSQAITSRFGWFLGRMSQISSLLTYPCLISGRSYHPCRRPGCLHTESTYGSNEKHFLARQLADLRRHEKAYVGTKHHFTCRSDCCTFVTQRWRDLKRHPTVMHCKNANRFPCLVLYCKFAGDNNGFLRKDKLTSQFKKVHDGVKAAPHGTLRAIKAAAAKEAVVDRAGSASGKMEA